MTAISARSIASEGTAKSNSRSLGIRSIASTGCPSRRAAAAAREDVAFSVPRSTANRGGGDGDGGADASGDGDGDGDGSGDGGTDGDGNGEADGRGEGVGDGEGDGKAAASEGRL